MTRLLANDQSRISFLSTENDPNLDLRGNNGRHNTRHCRHIPPRVLKSRNIFRIREMTRMIKIIERRGMISNIAAIDRCDEKEAMTWRNREHFSIYFRALSRYEGAESPRYHDPTDVIRASLRAKKTIRLYTFTHAYIRIR